MPRPVRPARNWKDGNFLGEKPASEEIRHRPVNEQAHAVFCEPIRGIAPEKR